MYKVDNYLGGEMFAKYRACTAGARYHAPDRSNRSTIAACLPILHRLKAAGFEATLADELRVKLEEYVQLKKALEARATTRLETVDQILQSRGSSLYPFQRIGVEWLAGRVTGLLADDMGLGKSIQALTVLEAPALVVCPSVVKGVWAAEAAKWRSDLKVVILEGRGSFRWPAEGELIITNYDILDVTQVGLFPQTDLIFDEGHALKNWKSRRTQKSRDLSEMVRKEAGRTFVLTATPLLGKPPELWSILQVAGCANEAFGSYSNFFTLFGGYKDAWGTRWGVVADPSVPDLLRKVSLRRMKTDVLKELPEKTYRTIEVEIDRKTLSECDRAWDDLNALGIDLNDAEALADATRNEEVTLENVSKARKALAIAKIAALYDLLDLYEAEGQPVVVFSRHRAPIDVLAKREGWATITGDNSKDSQEISERFQNGEFKGIAGTIQAMGVGITLTRSCQEIFIDLDWTPALNEQAEDRCCRIGQRNAVMVTTLVADHVMDRHVAKLVQKKRRMIGSSVDASAIGGSDASQMAEEGIVL